MTSATELRDLDLTTDSNFVAASNLSPAESRDYKNALNIDGFLQTNCKPPMKYGETRMALVDGRLSFLKGKRLYGTRWQWGDGLPTKASISSQINDAVPSGVVLSRCPRKVENQNHRLLLLLNSDDGDDFAVEASRTIVDDKTIKALNLPSVSYTCLAAFYRKPGNKIAPAAWVAIRKLEAGKLGVVDYEQVVSVEISDADAKKFRAWHKKHEDKRGACPINPPAPGFELAGLGKKNLRWERPAATLLFDEETEQCMLFFGDKAAELPRMVKGLDEAFQAIVPPELAGRHDVKSLGEWYVVPVKTKDVPEKSKCVALGDDGESTSVIKLPHKEDEPEYFVQSCDIRVASEVFGKDVTLEDIDGNLEQVKGWSVLMRNTTARIVEANGVE